MACAHPTTGTGTDAASCTSTLRGLSGRQYRGHGSEVGNVVIGYAYLRGYHYCRFCGEPWFLITNNDLGRSNLLHRQLRQSSLWRRQGVVVTAASKRRSPARVRSGSQSHVVSPIAQSDG